MTDAHVVMLSRVPVPGKVKTRLERVLRPRDSRPAGVESALLRSKLFDDAADDNV